MTGRPVGSPSLIRYDSVASTNDEARALLDQGAADGTWVWARRQEAGRGRRGRNWTSPEGNLYASVLLRPDRPMVIAPQLSFVAVLAVADLVDALLPSGRAPCRVKWPNDVLIDGAKLSGILLEAGGDGAAAAVWVVVGMGVNLRHAPTGTRQPAASLAGLGATDLEPAAALRRLMATFTHWYSVWLTEGFAPVRTGWLSRACGMGETITVQIGTERIEGRLDTLDADGALVVSPLDGSGPRRITAGDVFFNGAGTARGA